MSTCLTCANWTGNGVPRWAFRLGMACCTFKTPAVTLNHWAGCSKWRQATTDQVDERVVWLGRCGVTIKPPLKCEAKDE